MAGTSMVPLTMLGTLSKAQEDEEIHEQKMQWIQELIVYVINFTLRVNDFGFANTLVKG